MSTKEPMWGGIPATVDAFKSLGVQCAEDVPRHPWESLPNGMFEQHETELEELEGRRSDALLEAERLYEEAKYVLLVKHYREGYPHYIKWRKERQASRKAKEAARAACTCSCKCCKE